MSNHTPGPWYVNDMTHNGWMDNAIYVAGNRGENLARVYQDFGNVEANARLIAAAPDNYECNIELAAIVRELCAAYNHPLPQASLERSEAALAKARGEK